MRALSIRQPWAWSILHAGKRIENRSWWTAYRGPLLLHASAGMGTRAEFSDSVESLFSSHLLTDAQWGALQKLLDTEQPTDGPGKGDFWLPGKLPRGGIVGRARLSDVLDRDGWPTEGRIDLPKLDKRWHVAGQFGFVLSDVEPLPFVACKGALGLFDLPGDLLNPPKVLTR